MEMLKFLFITSKLESLAKKFSEGINENNVRTSVAGLSEILDDGSLFIDETQSGSCYFLIKEN